LGILTNAASGPATAAVRQNASRDHHGKRPGEDPRKVKNGIWLCQTCAIRIDHDPERFPAEMLRSWKELAELKAHEIPKQGTKANDFALAILAPLITPNTKTIRSLRGMSSGEPDANYSNSGLCRNRCLLDPAAGESSAEVNSARFVTGVNTLKT
jgi:hypothetical protein